MAAVMAGPADLGTRAEQRTRFANAAVTLPEMHTVGAEPFGQRHAVVDDEGDVRVGADALQRLGEPRQFVLRNVLDPQLERGCDPWSERRPQPIGKRPADLLRADQIELRRRRPLGWRKIDRVELGFVEGQAGILEMEAS
jgi:hypothetical protein